MTDPLDIARRVMSTPDGETFGFSAADVVAVMRALLAAHEWVPVKTRQPGAADANKKGLVLGLTGAGHMVVEWWAYATAAHGYTHWRPLPPPPEEKA